MDCPEQFDVLCDPITGDKLAPEFPANGKDGPIDSTGLLKGPSGEFPVIGGVVVFRQDLMTNAVVNHARDGDYRRALFSALKVEKRSTSAAIKLLGRLKWSRFSQFYGSPRGTLTGEAGEYFRYRYCLPNVPNTIGLISCLNRLARRNTYLLDVGCGFAHFYRYCLRAYAARRVVLQDYSLEALFTASRFIDRRSLLVCSDANCPWPFRRDAFSDIVALDTFEQLADKKGFLKRAIPLLENGIGTLWLTNITATETLQQFAGVLPKPTDCTAAAKGSKWRIFPDQLFAEAVIRGNLINIGVGYVFRENDPYWKSWTLGYSNASWNQNNKFVPLNRAPQLKQLSYSPLYCVSPRGRRLLKRRAINSSASVSEDFPFSLPETITIRASDPNHEPQSRDFAAMLVMIESLCERRRVVVAELLSFLNDRWRSFIATCRSSIAVFIPQRVKHFIKGC